jgi:hypothetical protein
VLASALSAALAGGGGGPACVDPGKPAVPQGKKRKPPRDPLAPKRPMNAYQVFMVRHRAEVMAQNPGLPFKVRRQVDQKRPWQVVARAVRSAHAHGSLGVRAMCEGSRAHRVLFQGHSSSRG